MSSGSTKAPKAPDPVLMAQLQNNANRVNEVGPFGSSMYSEDGDGRATRTTTMSPELQQAYQRMNMLAGQSGTWQAPAGYDQLTNAVGQRVADRYGLQSKPQQQPMQQPRNNTRGGT